jgi:hypothetical protein
MRTDSALRYEAMDALMRTLGEVDTERFISMVKRDTFRKRLIYCQGLEG